MQNIVIITGGEFFFFTVLFVVRNIVPKLEAELSLKNGTRYKPCLFAILRCVLCGHF